MPKRIIKRFLPDDGTFRDHERLRKFGRLMHDPNIWHLNRRSVSGAAFVGIFMAFVPVPFQMLLAAGAAIALRVNLPLSVILVWITNPITAAPLSYFAYTVGTWILGAKTQNIRFDLSVQWLMEGLEGIWGPFLLGCFVTGAFFALLGYFGTRLLWRWYVIDQWQKRKDTREQ